MTDRAAVDSRAEYGDEELAVEPRIARQPCSRTYPPIQSHSSLRAIIVGPAGQSGRFRTSLQLPNHKRLRSPWGPGTSRPGRRSRYPGPQTSNAIRTMALQSLPCFRTMVRVRVAARRAQPLPTLGYIWLYRRSQPSGADSWMGGKHHPGSNLRSAPGPPVPSRRYRWP